MASTTKVVTLASTINDLPDELLRLISISAGPTEYCNFRRAMKRVWLYTTGREDHCIKHFLVTKVNKDGNTRTTLCGNCHSMFDKPSYRDVSGTQVWSQYGKRHRSNDHPAYIRHNRSKAWYQHGKKHRDNDLPAELWADGTRRWYQHGKLHRGDDRHAVIYSDGTQRWYKHGVEYTP